MWQALGIPQAFLAVSYEGDREGGQSGGQELVAVVDLTSTTAGWASLHTEEEYVVQAVERHIPAWRASCHLGQAKIAGTSRIGHKLYENAKTFILSDSLAI